MTNEHIQATAIKVMILNTFKVILTLYILAFLSSCKGPGNTGVEPNGDEGLIKGNLVNALDDRIWVILQDSMGTYWFGSNGNGLYRFNGSTIRQFTSADGLISNEIRGIQEGSGGQLFLETPDGISTFDGTAFTTLNPIISDENTWRLTPGDLWFNCNGKAEDVYRYNGKNLYQLKLPRKDLEKAFGIVEDRLSYNPYSVFGIDKDTHGNIWFGTLLAGVFRYDGVSFLWIGEKELSRQQDGSEPGVRAILEDTDGTIWPGSFSSKYRIENGRYQKVVEADRSNTLPDSRTTFFNSGIVDENGDLWMTTYRNGVWRYHEGTLEQQELKSINREVLLVSIYQDRDATIWIGTDNDGAYTFNGEAFEKFQPTK